ncbi:MAG: transposase [Eubacteriaceae bacterium]|nr:transposase [Eubacteriaceae bacterium]
MELPKRKPQRLKEYDYSQSNAYYITICTKDRMPLLGKIECGNMVLSEFGKKVKEKLLNISRRNDTGVVPYIFSIDKYCIMPNHIHAIILILKNNRQKNDITIFDIVKQFKTVTTRIYIDYVQAGNYEPFNKKIWQKSFYDRIIRNETDYQHTWKYIDENVLKWNEDEMNTDNLM